MGLSEDIITKLKEYFSNQPVLKAYIFGSFAKGLEKEDSDIDVLVDLDYSQHIGLQFFGMQLELEKLLGKKVDLVSSKGISKYIKPRVDKEKRLIYAK